MVSFMYQLEREDDPHEKIYCALSVSAADYNRAYRLYQEYGNIYNCSILEREVQTKDFCRVKFWYGDMNSFQQSFNFFLWGN